MKYKTLIAIIITAVMVSSVMAMVPLNSGSQANSPEMGGMMNDTFNTSINSHFTYMHNYGAKLTYNKTTGNITGKYLVANYDSSTHVFSNVTYNLTSTELISKMYATGSPVSISDISKFMGDKESFSYTIGNMFLYDNLTSFIVLHNSPALESNMMVNGELYLYVPSGAHIYNTSDNVQVTTSANASMNSQINTSLFSSGSMAMFNFDNTVNAGREMITIDNNGTIAMLFIHNGNFKIKGNEITISQLSSNSPVLVNMVVPPGLQNISGNAAMVHNIMNGKISSEIALNYVNGTMANSTINYNSSIHFTYTGKTTSTASFDINSSVNHHTIVTVFIGNHAMNNTGHAYVKFDGKIATYVSMSALVNETSTTHAYYSYTNTSSGMYVSMYIPHFSNHTMVISNVPFQNSHTEYYIIGGIVAAIAIIGAAIYFIKKKK